MKITTAFITLLLVLLFSSCLDTEEKIVINKNNSGVYSLTLDLSKILVIMEQMGQQDKEEGKIPQKKDSTVYFKPLVDTSSILSPREKELFSPGSLRIQVDEQADKLIATLVFPFKHIDDLPVLKDSYLAIIDKMGISEKLKQNEDSEVNDLGASSLSSQKNILTPSKEAYRFAASAGDISNTLINKGLFDNLVQKDSSLQMLQQMSVLMGDMNYKTVIQVPRKIKSYTGNQAALSADKKTVSFSTTLSDVLNRPEAAAYSVKY
ncbi:MAG: hypothetical protein M9904_15100 [Chitinophagaceae bacterium]|nr:hypothetical protein [Chitinophagaceae bacterium]